MLSRLKVASLAVALVSVNTWAPNNAHAQGAGPQPGAGAEPETPPSAEPVEQQPPPGEATAAPAAATPKPKGQVEEILVTGSRIRRMDLTTAAPVTVIGKDQMQASGKVSIGDFLQSLPEQSNAINTAVNNGGDGSVRVNLRGLGSARTLVLINGRRMVPGGTGADSSVDLTTIPTAAIERVEVLKDGASAVYGSDAIGGVVNLITRKDWTGTELNAFAGTSTHGDGTLYDLNATIGAASDKGTFIFSGGYYHMAKVMAGDRGYSKIPVFYDATEGEYTTGSSGVPEGVITIPAADAGQINPAATPLYNDLVTTYPEENWFIRDPNAPGGLGWRPFNTSAIAGMGGDLYNYAPVNYLVTPQQRMHLYGTGDYKLGDVARAYFEATYVNRQSSILLAAEPLFTSQAGLTISADSMYNPFGIDIPNARRRLLEFGGRKFVQDLDTVRAVGGFDGTLSPDVPFLSGWFWDASLNYGRNFGTQTTEGSLRAPLIQNAIGPSRLIDGVPTCLDSAGNAIDGCVPLDLLGGPGTITPDQVAGLGFTGTQKGYNDLLAVQANISGELFPLLADRPIGLALGYEYRLLKGAAIPDPITAAGETTGNAITPTSGQYHVNEGYAELSLPIISGMTGVEDFEATLAARIFNYNTFGTDWTYKAGARWKIIPDVTVRGTYSTAFRAPSIADLYSGQYDSFPNVSDPCADTSSPQCAAEGVANNGDVAVQLRTKYGGNPSLKPETAKIFTVGIVLEPTMLEGLSVTVDYYNISMEKMISDIGANVILNSCYVATTPKFCDLVQRDPTTGFVQNIINTQQNVGSLKTDGIDIALRYALATEVGRFGLSFDGTWLDKYDLTLADGTVLHGKGTYDMSSQGQGGVYPAFRFNAGVAYSLAGLAAGVNLRFVGSFKECGDDTGDFSGSGLCYIDSTYSREVGAYQMWDLFASYTFELGGMSRTTLGLGVNNVFNRDPQRIYNGFTAASDPTAYDFMGRYFYARLVQAF